MQLKETIRVLVLEGDPRWRAALAVIKTTATAGKTNTSIAKVVATSTAHGLSDDLATQASTG